MKNLVFLSFILCFISCIPQEVEQSNNTQISKWNRSFPIALKISDDFDAVEINEIETSSGNWDKGLNNGQKILDVSQTTNSKSNNLNSYQDSEFGIYKVFNWPSELPDGALAVTQLFGTRRNIGSSTEYIEINHADILVNYDSDFEYFTTYGYDLQSVVLHEMGHFVGLFHENSAPEESVMYPSISRWPPNRLPKQNDINNLKKLYNFSNTIQAASVDRGIASSGSSTQTTEAVVILFEMRADGKEVITIKEQQSNKIISHDTAGCEH
jgi:hypothetical protein